MRNASGSSWCSRVAVLQQVLGPKASPHGFGFDFGLRHPTSASSSPGACGIGMEPSAAALTPPPEHLLFRALTSLNLLLLVGYLLLLLLAKLVARLHHHRTSSWYDDGHGRCSDQDTDTEECITDAAVMEGHQRADSMFWFDEAVFEDTTLQLLGDEGKDHLYATDTARCLQQVDGNNFPFSVEESAVRILPRIQNHRRNIDAEPVLQVVHEEEEEAIKGIGVDVLTTVLKPEQRSAPAPAPTPVVVVPPDNVSIEGNKQQSNRPEKHVHGRGDADADADRAEHIEEKTRFSDEGQQQHDLKRFVNSRALADTRKLLLEAGVVAGAGGGGGAAAKAAQLRQEEKDAAGDSSRFGFGGGASTLTSESTSKSSVEWQMMSSTTNKDYSETEYPFSSSSRRSSARWESYTLFRKYDEDMIYFHRVGAQKLTETESFRSIKYQPRSMSERIVQKLTPKPISTSNNNKPPTIGLRDPYPELERAYVAQVCLTWEALNWNYTSFRRHNGGDGNIAARCCPARVAQEFQQFQVLLHRFIENEPYEHGRRPEVYARMKNSTPKLLLVPEFRDEEDEKDDLISAVQFLLILEESIRTFMTFLRADKRSHYEMFREMVKRRASAVDQSIVITLKKANKKKKSRLKDLTRPRRCLKRTRLREAEELSILLGLIDLKVVARVLRMPEVTDQQLHWCEEKMNRVRIDLEGKMQRDPAPLFYPAH